MCWLVASFSVLNISRQFTTYSNLIWKKVKGPTRLLPNCSSVPSMPKFSPFGGLFNFLYYSYQLAHGGC